MEEESIGFSAGGSVSVVGCSAGRDKGSSCLLSGIATAEITSPNMPTTATLINSNFFRDTLEVSVLVLDGPSRGSMSRVIVTICVCVCELEKAVQ